MAGNGSRLEADLDDQPSNSFDGKPLADYLLDKNPSAGTKIKIEVEGTELKFVD